MASYEDQFTRPSAANAQHGWLHDLARAEVHPEAERLLQLGKAMDPQQLIEESTIGLLTQLRERFTEYCRVFNAYSESGSRFAEVKIYSIAQTAADFMMFRNQIKLVVSNTAHGVVQLAFAHHIRTTMDVNGAGSADGSQAALVPGQAQELIAQLGPFRDAFWTFQGERVNAEQVARYYFAEFSKLTRETRKSKANNQLLLDQIKALLQEKGLDL